jgi:hypothetical protein
MTVIVKNHLLNKWNLFRKHFDINTERQSRYVCDYLVQAARNFAPVWRGVLADGIYAKVIKLPKDGNMTISFGNPVSYALEQETGMGLPSVREVNSKMKQWALSHGYNRALMSPVWVVKQFTPHMKPPIETGREIILEEGIMRAITKSLRQANYDKFETIKITGGVY